MSTQAHFRLERPLQVFVRENNVDQALRILKKRMQREGIFREIRQHSFYEKPSEKRVREKAEAIRRSRKLARKKAQRDRLLPRSKPRADAKRGRTPDRAVATPQ
jgi:small subunit ribosomal protein S21